MNKLILTSADRAELIIDFSEYEEGETVELTDKGTSFIIGTKCPASNVSCGFLQRKQHFI